MNIGVTVKDDGKADLELLAAMQGEGSSLNPDNKQNLESRGYSIEEYSEEGYSGAVIKKENIDPTELCDVIRDIQLNQDGTTPGSTEYIEEEGMSGTVENQGGSFNMSIDGNDLISDKNALPVIEKEGKTYNFRWDGVRKQSGEQETDSSYVEQVANMLKQSGGYITFTLNLPVKAYESNADEVSEDGKTLKWDLLNYSDPNIYASFQIKKGLNISKETAIKALKVVILIAIIFAFLIPAALGIMYVINHRQPKQQAEMSNREPIQENQDDNGCPWCQDIEDRNFHILYYAVNRNNKVVSYDGDTKEIIKGTAKYCPNCGRELFYG